MKTAAAIVLPALLAAAIFTPHVWLIALPLAIIGVVYSCTQIAKSLSA